MKPQPKLRAGMTATASSNVHFSSKTDLWATPQAFFDRYNAIYQFTLDVCALPDNAKCERYFTPEQDGLAQDWTGACWMNPPYGRTIGSWIRKAFESAQQGATVVCLLPARTDTGWWHDYCQKGQVEFIRGRLKFGGHKNSAPLSVCSRGVHAPQRGFPVGVTAAGPDAP
jgi:phage N-6-adenine-methyltransferase